MPCGASRSTCSRLRAASCLSPRFTPSWGPVYPLSSPGPDHFRSRGIGEYKSIKIKGCQQTEIKKIATTNHQVIKCVESSADVMVSDVRIWISPCRDLAENSWEFATITVGVADADVCLSSPFFPESRDKRPPLVDVTEAYVITQVWIPDFTAVF